jgi:tRNA(adenine34) deaminase
MRVALEVADEAEQRHEVPVGAVLVGPEGEIARGSNAPISLHDPTAHAEINVLREAGRRIGNYRLPGTTLYVTVEPCTMCAGALVHARVARVVFGAREPKGGALVSRASADGRGVLAGLNHSFDVVEGVLGDECAEKLSRFFDRRRS